MKDFAIIGAGLSGATLAHQLTQQGHRVTLYEKSRGTGGRMASCRLGDFSANLGAPFAEAHTTEFENWLQNQAGMEQKIFSFQAFNSTQKISQTAYTHTNRLSQLTRDLVAQANLVSSTRIGYIWPETDGIIVRDVEGQLISTHDAAIVTAPPQQAAPLLEAVPRFSRIAESVKMSIAWVLILETDTLDFAADGFIATDAAEHESLSRIIRQKTVKDEQGNSRDIWLVEAKAQWSEAHQDDDKQAVEHQLTNAFTVQLQAHATQQVKIHASRIHRWLYNRVANPQERPQSRSLWSPETSIGACGDWLGGDGSGYGLEGAWHSAMQLAEQLKAFK